jgi:hypothetical protein
MIQRIEQRGLNIITRKCSSIDLHISTAESVAKKKTGCLVFNCLHNNVCNIYKNIFVENNHGHHTRNNHNLKAEKQLWFIKD